MTSQETEMIKKLRTTMGKMELALGTIIDSIVWTSSDGVIQWCNDTFSRLVSLPRIEIIGAKIQNILHLTTEERSSVREENPFALALQSKSRLSAVYKFTKSSFIHYLEVTSSRFELLQPEESVVFVIRDITDFKKLEEQFLQSQKMQAIGKLAGSIAHDFNNILTVVQGYSEILLDEVSSPDTSSIREKIEMIYKASQEASLITRQLLAFSRQEVASPKVFKLNTLLLQNQKMLEHLVGEQRTLNFIFDKKEGNIKADPSQIQQVILNLVVNAKDAMPTGGNITIETKNVRFTESFPNKYTKVKLGDYVMLAVTDTGVGMSAEMQAHIFEPFYTTKEKGRGTGLGLSTIYGIVEKSGGNIWVYSEAGKGTVIKIYFPQVFEAAQPLEVPRLKDIEYQGSGTILLIEDEILVRKWVLQALSQIGYQVYDAGNGVEALELAFQIKDKVNLVISDLVMPKMGGVEVAEQLKKRWSDFKILFISGYTDNTAFKETVWGNKVNFLQKPFSKTDLYYQVKQLII